MYFVILMNQQAQTRDSLEKRTPRSPRLAPMPEGRPEKPEKVPAWIVIMFIFALAFCLFAVYKAFIFKQGYDFSFIANQPTPEVIDVNLSELGTGEDAAEEEQSQNSDFGSGLQVEADVVSSGDVQSGVNERLQEAPTLQVGAAKLQWETANSQIDRSQDQALIQSFYQHMLAGDFDAMNALIAGPLLRSKTRNDHWNSKNLGIFKRNLVGQLNLDNLFFVANSINEAKKSRQYTYTLNYTIQPDREYKEDRKITLTTQGTGTVLISEIMCETKWCSRSPFFWPQNLGLK